MEISKTIDFKLLINENGTNGIVYKHDLEADLGALLIVCEVLEHNISSAKEMKKTPQLTRKYKDALTSQINLMTNGLKALNSLSSLLLDNYQDFKENGQGTGDTN